jgi:selenocysteine lyase/cysteine desulfurase
MTDFFASQNRMASRDLLAWYNGLDHIRTRAARLINAQPEDIAFFPSTSHVLAELLHGIPWQPGDQVLALENEFPNNIYAPAALRERQVEFREIPRGELNNALNPRVRLVLASVMNYADGYRFPWQGLREKLDQHNTLLFLDGTQGCGALHLDLAQIRPDALAVHGYKWLLSPAGAGFAYIAPHLRAWLQPQVIGWRSHHAWRDVDNLHHGPPVYPSTAQRYEGAMQPLALLFAMEQSINLMLELTPAAIESRILSLAAQAKTIIEKLGGTVAHSGSPILACSFPRQDPSRLSQALETRNIFTSARQGKLRISLHLYNNESDLEALASALRAEIE